MEAGVGTMSEHSILSGAEAVELGVVTCRDPGERIACPRDVVTEQGCVGFLPLLDVVVRCLLR